MNGDVDALGWCRIESGCIGGSHEVGSMVVEATRLEMMVGGCKGKSVL
jgi:hypothetical protein